MNLLEMFEEFEEKEDLIDSIKKESREYYLRSPFGWPGSKLKSLPDLLPHLPYRKIWVDHCTGSGQVTLARKKSKLEIMNDRNNGVVAFFRCIRDKEKSKKLVDRLKLIVHSREEFIWCRDTWKTCQDDVERAARWYYIIRMSFGFYGRNFARAISGENPFSRKTRNSLKLFPFISERLEDVQIENLSLFQCMVDFDSKETVHYLDPNYYGVTKNVYPDEIADKEHKTLCEMAFQMKGCVALSGYANPIYDSFKWDKRITWKVHSSMVGFAFTESNHLKGKENVMGRGDMEEVLWIKY